MKAINIVAFLIPVSLSLAARAAEIRVAAAADLKFALEDVIAQYQQKFPKEQVTAAYGASGTLQMQIQQNAPFDLFLSADSEKPEALVKSGHAAGMPFPYAEGHLVVWEPASSKLKLDADLKCLLNPAVKHVAVAHAVNAPYGQIADAAMKKAGVFERVKEKLVVGENIAQAAQFAVAGAAEIGLISRSLALSPEMKSGTAVDVKADLYQPLKQSGVVVKGKNEKAARAFADFFAGDEGRRILSQHGLTPWKK